MANITRCSPRPRCRARRWERDAAVIFSGGGSRCVCVGATRDRDARRPGNEAAPARTPNPRAPRIQRSYRISALVKMIRGLDAECE